MCYTLFIGETQERLQSDDVNVNFTTILECYEDLTFKTAKVL